MCSCLGTWPTTQACTLPGNRTGDLLVCRPALNPLSHTSQGTKVAFLLHIYRRFNQLIFFPCLLLSGSFATSCKHLHCKDKCLAPERPLSLLEAVPRGSVPLLWIDDQHISQGTRYRIKCRHSRGLGRRVQTASYRISHRDATYSIGDIVNNTVITMCGVRWLLESSW